MGRGVASGEGTGFGSAEIGVDVSVAVDQESVGVVGRRGGADSDVGDRYRDGSQLPSKTSGKTKKEGRREEGNGSRN